MTVRLDRRLVSLGLVLILATSVLFLAACQAAPTATPTKTPTPPAAAASTPAPSAPTAAAPAGAASPIAVATPTAVGLTFDAQVTRGQQVFTQRCAGCHGPNGEGITAPALIGSKQALATYGKNAGDILNFAKTFMPANAPGSLPDADYVAVVAFVLKQNGLYSGPQPLTAASAASVPVSK